MMPLSNSPSGLARLLISPLTGALVFTLFTACSKAPRDAGASPSPSPTQPPANTLAPVLSHPPTTPLATNPETTAASPTATPGEDDADEVPLGQLQQKYFATRDEDERTEIVSQIGDKDNLEAIQTLTRIFTAEPSTDLRTQILGVAADLADDDTPGVKEAKLLIYNTALNGSQAPEIRSAAVDGLEQLDDPRTLSLWQRLLSDPDEDIRDSAQAAIERFKEKSE